MIFTNTCASVSKDHYFYLLCLIPNLSKWKSCCWMARETPMTISLQLVLIKISLIQGSMMKITSFGFHKCSCYWRKTTLVCWQKTFTGTKKPTKRHVVTSHADWANVFRDLSIGRRNEVKQKMTVQLTIQPSIQITFHFFSSCIQKSPM